MISDIKSIVVDCIDSEFYVDVKSDDMGLHYVIYLPNTVTGTEKLRKHLQKIDLDKRYVIMLVPEGYIKYNFLGL